MADGRRVPVDRGSGIPVLLGPTPEGVYGQGAGGYSTGVDLTMYGFTLHVGEITGRYFRRDNPCSKVWRLS